MSDFAPTGSTLLDLIVGGGVGEGYSFGNVINIVGDTGAGKTLLACEVIAASHYKYGEKLKWVYDDCESGFTFDTEKLYGFEIMPKNSADRTRSNTVEDAYVNVRKFVESLKKGEHGIYVIDSLDGLTSKELDRLADDHYKQALKGEDSGKGSYKVGKAKYLSQEFFPQLVDLLEKTNCILIVISQVRENINPRSFEKYVRSGGKAMDFYCHTVLWLAAAKKVRRKDIVIGVVIKAKTTKSKTPRPYREGFITVYFNYGIDDVATNVDFLYGFRTDTGELVKNASAIWQEGKEINSQNIKNFLIENNLEEQCIKDCGKSMKKSTILEWIMGNEELKEKFSQVFGKELPRDELIQYIEQNNLENELKERTKKKWEMIEEAAEIYRKPKYQN